MAEPLDMIRCDRRTLTLTRSACGRMWRSAQETVPKPWEGRAACRTCALGASVAGITMASTQVAVEELRRVCVACHQVSDRLVHDIHCVSCFNRNREVLRGRNSKGNRPRLADVLHTRHMAVSSGGGVAVKRLHHVRGPGEMVLTLAKRATGALAFGRPRVVRFANPSPQGDLFTGTLALLDGAVQRATRLVARQVHRARQVICGWVQGDLFAA